MFGDGEGSTVEIRDGMAELTTIVVRHGGKLIVVRIFVAIGAGCEFHIVNGVFAGRNVALRAFHLNVLAFERVAGIVVLLRGE